MNRKGVTPVIASILLVTVTVAAVGSLYAFVQETQEKAREGIDVSIPEPSDLSVESCYGNVAETTLSVRNSNDEAINASKINPFINGRPFRDNQISRQVINPSGTFQVSIDRVLEPNTNINLIVDGDKTGHICRAERENLVGFYRFEEIGSGAGEVKDSSGKENDGNAYNGVNPDVEGIQGSEAYEFDGSSSYVNVSNAVAGEDAVSASFWVYPYDLSQERVVSGDWNNQVFILQYDNTAGEWAVRMRDSDSNFLQATSAASLSTDSWTHLAFTYNRNGQLKLYVNGQMEDSTAANGFNIRSSGNRAGIGTAFWSGFNWNGRIDNVKFFDRTLSEEEVEKMYEVKAN